MTQPVAVRRPPLLAIGTMVWLASELMFFAGLFAAWFTLRAAAASWPPPGVHLDTARAAAFTMVLVASSVTAHLGSTAARSGRAAVARRWFLLTVALGVVFLANQGAEWAALDFSASSHAFGSAFYLLTGFHGLHVLVGVLAFMALLVWLPPQPPARAGVGAEVVSWYWHFVDVVWVAVFLTVFVLG